MPLAQPPCLPPRLSVAGAELPTPPRARSPRWPRPCSPISGQIELWETRPRSRVSMANARPRLRDSRSRRQSLPPPDRSSEVDGFSGARAAAHLAESRAAKCSTPAARRRRCRRMKIEHEEDGPFKPRVRSRVPPGPRRRASSRARAGDEVARLPSLCFEWAGRAAPCRCPDILKCDLALNRRRCVHYDASLAGGGRCQIPILASG